MAELEPPPGWTVVRERRQAITEDAASAFTDGHQWTVRDPDGQRPPQAEWPTAWYRQAVLYAHMMASRDPDAAPPPYAPSPAAENMLPRQHREPVHEHFLRKWQRDGEAVHPVETVYASPPPDVALTRRPITELAELLALCGGAKSAMGATKEFPAGQLGPGWTWWARHGYGWRGRDGRITESLYLRVDRAPRSALFLWSRPVPDPRSVLALVRVLRGWTAPPLIAVTVRAVLAQLPAPGWSSDYVTAWTTTAAGRPEDIPRPTPSATVKKEIRN